MFFFSLSHTKMLVFLSYHIKGCIPGYWDGRNVLSISRPLSHSCVCFVSGSALSIGANYRQFGSLVLHPSFWGWAEPLPAKQNASLSPPLSKSMGKRQPLNLLLCWPFPPSRTVNQEQEEACQWKNAVLPCKKQLPSRTFLL